MEVGPNSKMKRSFFQAAVVSILIWMHHMDAYKTAGEEAGQEQKQVLATTPHETPTIRTLAPHHKFDVGEARTSS